MAIKYNKTIWKNREVERPRTYNIQENEDGTITLIPAEGAIIEPGTPITAQVMQNIEDGIEALDNTLKSHLADYATITSKAVIVEYEIDTNSMFIRFGNGIQICAGRHVVNRTIVANWESGFSHAPETITFPKSFISEPFVSFGYSDPTGSNIMAMVAGTRITKENFRCSIVRPADDVSRERHITYIAIGRWK